MPTDADVDNRTGGSDQAVAGTTPSFSLGDIKGALRDFARELVNEVQSRTPKPGPKPDPEPEGLNEEEFESFTPAQRSAVEKGIRRGLHGVQKQLNEIRNVGNSRLADLTERAVGSELPYYAEYKDEIRGELNALDPALRIDPKTVEIVHDRVVARHVNELVAKARNEGIESARGDAPGPSGNSARGARSTDKGVPTPEDLGFGEDQIRVIEAAGGPDAFARKVSEGRIPDWKTYTERHANYRTSRTAKGGSFGSVINFRKATLKKGTGEGDANRQSA